MKRVGEGTTSSLHLFDLVHLPNCTAPHGPHGKFFARPKAPKLNRSDQTQWEENGDRRHSLLGGVARSRWASPSPALVALSSFSR